MTFSVFKSNEWLLEQWHHHFFTSHTHLRSIFNYTCSLSTYLNSFHYSPTYQSLIFNIYVLIHLLCASLSNLLAVSYREASIESRVVSIHHLVGMLTPHTSNPLNVVLREHLMLNQQNAKLLSGSSPVFSKTFNDVCKAFLLFCTDNVEAKFELKCTTLCNTVAHIKCLYTVFAPITVFIDCFICRWS